MHAGSVEVTPTEPPAAPEFTYANVIAAAVSLTSSMGNNVLPGTLYIGTTPVTPAQFQYAACQVVIGLDSGNTTGEVNIPSIAEAPNPSGSATGQVPRADYVAMAQKIITFVDSNGAAPNFSTSSTIGQVNYYDVVHMYAKILNYYNNNNALPNYNTVVGWSGTVSDTVAPTTVPTSSNTSTTPATDWYPLVVEAATYVTNYVQTEEAMPTSIPVGSNTCTPAQYLYLVAQVLVGLNGGTTSGELSIPSYNEPTNPSETVVAGTLNLSEVVTMANNVLNFMRNNGQGPNYMTSSLGTMHYYNGIYMYSQAVSSYGENGTLPASIKIETWYITTGGTIVEGDATFGNDFSAYAKFLVPTNNCQSTNATIITVAKTGMMYSSGADGGYPTPTSTYQAMFNLMEYINDMTSYEYYSESHKGALGTWSAKAGNCCDMAHLVNACARSLGVPGKYEHWNCTFSYTTTGHVWAALYCPDAPSNNINGTGYWLYADPVNNGNYLGYQTHRNNYEYGDSDCAELPF